MKTNTISDISSDLLLESHSSAALEEEGADGVSRLILKQWAPKIIELEL